MQVLKLRCFATLIALVAGCVSTDGRLAQPAAPATARGVPAAAFAAAPVTPATTAVPAAPANDAAEPKPSEQAPEEELICRREAAVGSHFRERRCYTRAQLEEMRRQSGEFIEEQGRQQVPPGAAQ
jgi:hypothetical protein